MQKMINWIGKNIPKYLLGAVLVIVPLFPKFPLISIPGTYVAIRFEDLLLLLTGLVVFLKIIKNPKAFLKDKIMVAFAIFFAINLVSLFSGIFLTKTVSLHLGILNYARRIEYLVPFFAILTLFNKEQITKNLDYFIKLLVMVTLIAFIYGLGQRYLSFPIIITQNDQYSKGIALRWTSGSHINSTFAGHYDLAAFMVMLLPIFISLILILKDKWNKIWLLITAGGGLWLLINSLSRISQVSYLFAITVALFFGRKFKALFVVLAISIILIGQSSSLYARFSRVIDVFYQKVRTVKLSSFTGNFIVHADEQTLPSLRPNLTSPTPTPIPVFEDRSTSIRLNVEWPAAIRAFSVNPLLGTGYSSIGLATDNDFLRMLGETGILGTLAFTLVFVRIGMLFVKAVPLVRNFSDLEQGFVLGMAGAILGILLSCMFIDLLEASKFATIFWFMIGYSICLIRIRTNE
jgi:hypothetical protein